MSVVASLYSAKIDYKVCTFPLVSVSGLDPC